MIRYFYKANLYFLLMEKTYDKLVDNTLDVFFGENKLRLYLILIFIVGFVLRLIAALNLSVSADDMHFSVHAINFLKSDKLVTYDQSSGLWYSVSDVFYSLFGISQLTSRLAALIFGSLSIIVLYLLIKELFDERAGLIGALLLAVSPFHIKYTISEMDVMAVFFVFFGMYLFIKGLKDEKKNLYLFSGISLGLAIFTKVYALLFIPVFVSYYFYFIHKKQKKFIDNSSLKKLFLFLVVTFIFCVPSLTHNYLLYKDKGFMDLIYTNALGYGREKAAQYYSWDTGWGHGADWKGFFFGKSIHLGGDPLPSSIYALKIIWNGDPVIFLLGIFGIFYCFIKKRREYLVILALTLIFVFAYLAARILLAKHYIFLLFLFIPPAGFMLSQLFFMIKNKVVSFRLRYLLIIIIIINLIILGFKTPVNLTPFYTSSEISQLMKFKEDKIPHSGLIVADSRIYRGQIHWALQGRDYMESAYLPTVLEKSKETGKSMSIETYYIECVNEDCGWGTIKDQPEFNSTMEKITEFFATQGKLQTEIYSATFEPYYFPFIFKKASPHFRIYKITLPIDPSVLGFLSNQRTWFLYPIGYDESIQPIFDKYSVNGLFDSLINKIAHLILSISLILAFLSILFMFYIFIQEQ